MPSNVLTASSPSSRSATAGALLATADLFNLIPMGDPFQLLSGGEKRSLLRQNVPPSSVSERASYLDAEGIGRVIDVDIAVRRAAKPSNGSFFSVFSGMFS